MTYFINGWRESRTYFMNLGRFTSDELTKLENGETIKKGENEFRIEKEN